MIWNRFPKSGHIIIMQNPRMITWANLNRRVCCDYCWSSLIPVMARIMATNDSGSSDFSSEQFTDVVKDEPRGQERLLSSLLSQHQVQLIREIVTVV